MTRMRTVDAAVRILEIEGATHAFGLPGAAINPFYSAMRAHGGINHILARHVEAASHMAEGFTRAAHGNIGVCIGTSGPAGTDMITGLYSAAADSIPILAITGQAPVARLHKEDFQAIDIASIAAPVTKMAMTVLEPGQVPGAFAHAFHLMRSGRPGPVLLDLPIDVQMAEIDFDPDTYQPLPVYKPAATREQAVRAIDMLVTAERPLLVAGGGIINADASNLLVELAEILNIPVVPTLMGWGSIPDDHRLAAGMAGLQTSHRYGNATMLASDFVLGIGNRWANRHTGGLDTYRRGRRFVHVDIEPTQIGRVFAPDYGIVSDAKAALEQFVAVAKERRATGALPDWDLWVDDCQMRKRTMHRKTHFDDVPIKPQRVYEEMNRVFGRDVRYVTAIGLSQIAGGQFLQVYKPRNWINCAALRARRGQQLIPRADPPGTTWLRHELSRLTGLRQHQCTGDGQRRAQGLWRRSPSRRRGPRLQGNSSRRSRRHRSGVAAGATTCPRAQGARRGRGLLGEDHQHRDGHRDRQRRRVQRSRRITLGRANRRRTASRLMDDPEAKRPLPCRTPKQDREQPASGVEPPWSPTSK